MNDSSVSFTLFATGHLVMLEATLVDALRHYYVVGYFCNLHAPDVGGLVG